MSQIFHIQNLRDSVISIVGESQFLKYKDVNVIVSISSIIGNWLLIFLLYFCFNLIVDSEYNYLFLPVILFLVATRQNALNVQVHEGSHYSLSKNRRINDFISNFLCGYWIFYSTKEYRNAHNKHHLYLNTHQDPDYSLQLNDFSKKSILLGFLSDFFGITAYRRGRALTKTIDINFLGKLICNLSLILLMSIGGNMLDGFFNYLIFWVFPLFCIFPCIIRLRINAEHSKIPEFDSDLKNFFICRTSKGNIFERFLLGSQMEYHFEHHLFPMIPYVNLGKIHDRLVNEGFFFEHPEYFNRGYISFWMNIIKS